MRAAEALPTVTAGEIDLTAVDGVLVRMMPPGSLEQVVFRMDALHRVAAAGVPVLNPPRAVEAAVDKYLTLALLEAAGLPVPPTWVGHRAAEGAGGLRCAWWRRRGQAAVRLRGAWTGPDQRRELAWRALHGLERLGSILYLQRFVRHPGYDYRVFVLRDEVLGMMKRNAAGNDWRTNVSQGGRAEPCRARSRGRTTGAGRRPRIGAGMAGVDLIPDVDRGHLVVLEVNAVPGWRALARVTGIDIAAEILAALERLGKVTA